MNYKPSKKISFSVSMGLRLVFLLASLSALSWAINTPNYYMTGAFLMMMVIAQGIGFIKFATRTNTEMARFLTALQYADYGQRFDFEKYGSNFNELGTAFENILHEHQTKRTNHEKDLIHFEALIEHSPTPLISVYGDNRIKLWNGAARHIFANLPCAELASLDIFEKELANQLKKIKSGKQAVVNCEIDSHQQKLLLTATQVIGNQGVEKLVSLQNIHTELEVTQLHAWEQLVRILTHEVMNSVAPIISLTQTSISLIEDASTKAAGHSPLTHDLDNIKNAMQTISSRSDHLTRFIASYRQITNLPQPNKTSVSIKDLFNGLVTLLSSEWKSKGISLVTDVNPHHLAITVDRGLIEQALLNLLKNAADTLEGKDNATVILQAYRNHKGRIMIDIEDNGPGIPKDIYEKIFVPFYTTKRQGCGVGLAIVRQIMVANGGSIHLIRHPEKLKLGGAKFSLTF